jgi:hypothetical protein
VDLETQSIIRLAKCERPIRRLYNATSEKLPPPEMHPLSAKIDDILSKSLYLQERWVTLTEAYLTTSCYAAGKSAAKDGLADDASFLYLTPSFTSRGRLKPTQARGLYPTKTWFPEIRAAGVIAAVSF